jgi:acyl-CoA thioesterase-1
MKILRCLLPLACMLIVIPVDAQNVPPRVIVALGDSMTAGYGVAAESSYPAQLEKELNKRGYPYRVVNLGVTGSTTAQAMGRLNRALAAGPDIVIIQLGGNDASQGISQNVSRENLRSMISKFKPGGAQIFFAGGRFPYVDALAREHNIPVIPFFEGVAGNRELLQSDGRHPTAEGYVVVVENILKVLEPFIREKKSSRVKTN